MKLLSVGLCVFGPTHLYVDFELEGYAIGMWTQNFAQEKWSHAAAT